MQAPHMNLDYKIYAECQAISKSLDDDLPAIKQELLDKYQLLLVNYQIKCKVTE